MKFDSSFNMQSDDQMYCSEMIKKSVAFATSNRIKIATTQPTANEIGILSKYIHLDSSAKPLEIVAIDNLYINPNCKLIREYKFFQ